MLALVATQSSTIPLGRARCLDALKRARTPSSTPAPLHACDYRLRNLDLLNLRSLFLHDRGRKRRVLQVRRVGLSLGQRPAQKLLDLLANFLVGLLLINQQPRER